MVIPPISVEIATASLGIAVLLVDLASRHARRAIWATSVAGLAIILALAVATHETSTILGGSYVADELSWLAKPLILLGAGLTAALSVNSVAIRVKYTGAYAALMVFATLGLLILVSSRELVTLVVGLETSAICLVGLTAISKQDDRSLEAGIKYLILGALSSGVLFYGLALLYAAAGSTSLESIGAAAAARPGEALIVLGTVLALLGVTFKLSAVPMHVWTPDVYQGAPTPVAAFVSVASKSAGFIFAIRIFLVTLPELRPVWLPLVLGIATLTMTVGNLAAIPQTSVKRLLAYSTISQAGYLLVGFVGSPDAGLAAVIFYLLVYTVTNVAAFAVVIAVSLATGSDRLEDYAGLARRSPLLALTFTLALLSLAGIPPLGGFAGKFYLFSAAMARGYSWLVVVAALNSVVSLFYYLLVLKRMYIQEPAAGAPTIRTSWTVRVVLAISLVGVFLLGIVPGPLMRVIQEAAGRALGGL
jgi:NADH-quinone oxidoreductase subunit N